MVLVTQDGNRSILVRKFDFLVSETFCDEYERIKQEFGAISAIWSTTSALTQCAAGQKGKKSKKTLIEILNSKKFHILQKVKKKH